MDPKSSVVGHSRRGSDASVMMSEDVFVSYDVRDEEAPASPFFSSAFRSAMAKGLDIARNSVAVIEKLGGDFELGSPPERLLAAANQLSTFRGQNTKTVAFLGDSGQGKSSLINSLLNFEDIAAAGDLGAACTSVVTEYRQRTASQEEPITIEVDYLSQTEIEVLVKELLWNYRRLYLPEIEEASVDAKDYARYQSESEQAWSALEAAFGHQSLFKEEFLTDMSDGALDRVTDELIRWSHDVEWPDGGHDGKWTSTAQTAEECYDKTSAFMHNKLWPFTKIIRVFLDAVVLENGLVLADLPGLQDTNLARVQATQTYLLKCDYVFIIANISRAITDKSLRSALYDVLTRHIPLEWEESAARCMNLAVICTKSESINKKTAQREFCGSGKRIEKSLIDRLKRDISCAEAGGNWTLKKSLKRRYDSLLLDARNSHVKEGLQAAYASKVPGGKLDVFCVSNTVYQKYSTKSNNDLVRQMVQSSGIPDLRRFCYSITAESRYLEAKHFLQSSLPSLLSSIQIWATTVPPERIERACSVLKDAETKVLSELQHFGCDFWNSFSELILEFLESRLECWRAFAEEESQKWFTWHHSQYKAWCLSNGNHETNKRGAVNWNGELIRKMRKRMAFQWNILENKVPASFEDVLSSVTRRLRDLQSVLRDEKFSSALIEGIDFRVRDIKFKIELAKSTFQRELRLIRFMASEANESSYITQETIPAYRMASQESGPGMSSRQRSHIQNHITNGAIFTNMSNAIQSCMREEGRKTEKELSQTIKQMFEAIKADVSMAASQERTDLACEVQALKTPYEQVLKSLSEVLDTE